MEVISISDTTDESVTSIPRSKLYYYKNNPKSSPISVERHLTDRDEVITLSSGDSGETLKSSETQRCRVTWNKEKKFGGPRITHQDFETPSPQKKVNSWMLNQQFYLLQDDLISGKKIPFSEQHLDSLAANALKLCSTEPQSDRKSSILVRQDYNKSSRDVSVGTINNPFISSPATTLAEINSSIWSNSCNKPKSCDVPELESSCLSNKLRNKISPNQKRRRSRSTSNLSENGEKWFQNVDQNHLLNTAHLVSNKSKRNSRKRSRSSSKSSIDLKRAAGGTSLCIEKYIDNNILLSCAPSPKKQEETDDVTAFIVTNKIHKHKSKSSDMPLSPESQKKNELCSYLQLMNTSIPKNQEILQNRRSTRVKNHQKLMEKRKMEQMLNVRESENNEASEMKENSGHFTAIEEKVAESSETTVQLQNSSENFQIKNSNFRKEERSLTRKSFAELKMEMFTPSWALNPNFLESNAAFLERSLKLNVPEDEDNSFDKIMQDFIRKEKIDCSSTENPSKIHNHMKNKPKKILNATQITKINDKKLVNANNGKNKNRKSSKKTLIQFKRNKDGTKSLNILKSRNPKEKIRFGRHWMSTKDPQKYFKSPKIQKRYNERMVNIKKRKSPEKLLIKNSKKTKMKKTSERQDKDVKTENSSPNSSKSVDNQSSTDKRLSGLHMNRIDYKNQSPTNIEARGDCKDLTLSKRLSLVKSSLEKGNSSHMYKITPMLHEKLKSQFELLKNLTPEHRKALFESKKFINWNLRNGQSVSPKTEARRAPNNCDTLKTSTGSNFACSKKTETRSATPEFKKNFYGFEDSEVSFSRDIAAKQQEILDVFENTKMRLINKKSAVSPVPSQEVVVENNESLQIDMNSVEGKQGQVDYSHFCTPKNKRDDVVISIPDSNTPELENGGNPIIFSETHSASPVIHQNIQNYYVPTSADITAVNCTSPKPLSQNLSLGHTSLVINHTSSVNNSTILSPVLSYVTLPPNSHNSTTLLAVNSSQLIRNTTIVPPNCSYLPVPANNPDKSLNCYLNRTKRTKIAIDADLQECESNGDEDDAVVTLKSHNRLEAVQSVQLPEDKGLVENAFFFDYTLLVVQEVQISFWKVCPLGNILGAHDMWEAKGNVCRLALENCIDKTSNETVMYLEKSVAYVELWVKEDNCTSLVNVFAVVYFWMECFNRPNKKLVQLENVKCSPSDIHYVVLKRSRKIIVTSFTVVNGVPTTFIQSYHLASDYQSIAGSKQMGPVHYLVSSMHNIQDCDTLIMGCGEQKITLWNVEYGSVVATIDLVGIMENPQTLWSKCDRGFLFVLQQFSDGVLKLIAINGINYTWKQLRSFEPNSNSGSLQGVCMENGILVAFYDNVTLCWKVENNEVILELPRDENVRLFISDKSVISISSDRMQVRNALQYLLTCDDIYNTQV